ncbi:glycosyltransferase [uncultured Alistipes sp.]|jgi:glycosyltransferase|uniref:glycosyltransferase family 2 protein n=1 Tax=uncultured Alistipes sp. TaxID=538949 RepID=UPI0025D1CEC2|nr:glycosyltransferase [uncultured Alistipes sp.]
MNATENTPVLVSVCCITYNQAPFIRRCLEGIMMQRTSFAFEVLVHDDASTDASADIIREYEAKYPGVVKPIYQKENQYSQGVKISATHQFPRAQGRYIALCEGDDYWTDPCKLQKQIDFLEANPDFSVCFHDVKIKKEEESVLVDDYITSDVPDVSDIYQLAQGNYMHTPSVVFRKNEKILAELAASDLIHIDYVLHMFNARHGRIKKLRDQMAVYRVHGAGCWSMKDNEFKFRNWLSVLKGLIPVFERQDQSVADALKRQYARTAYCLVSLYKEEDADRKDDIDRLVKDVCGVAPYYFHLETEREMATYKNLIDKYKNTLLYKVYAGLRKLVKALRFSK